MASGEILIQVGDMKSKRANITNVELFGDEAIVSNSKEENKSEGEDLLVWPAA